MSHTIQYHVDQDGIALLTIDLPGKPMNVLTPELMQELVRKDWKGNVRELSNTIKRAVVMSPGDMLGLEESGIEFPQSRDCSGTPALSDTLGYKEAKSQALREFHQAYLEQILRRSDGNISRAAQLCGIERQYLQQVLKKYHVDAREFRE